jgi:hypothetical protein
MAVSFILNESQRPEPWKRGFHLPPPAEQGRIVALLAAMDREMGLLERMQTTIAEQKQGQMQKPLTEEVRVTDPTEDA